MKKIVILGSSGSIGTQTLGIISGLKNSICVKGLAVRSNLKVLKSQIKKFRPKAVSMDSFIDANNLKKWCTLNNLKTSVYSGSAGPKKLATMPGVDMVFISTVGIVSFEPIISAIKAKKNIAIANKEVLVMAGNYIMNLAIREGISVLPVDSEHSAIFQCCADERKSSIKKIILTASGGPFYKYDKDFSKITVEQTLEHPIWKMGSKVTVDSATLMNKGLEAIEASVLFGISIDKIKILIHPQSIVHSMVEYIDGSVIAQLSNPDMRLPIQYALTYPERSQPGIRPLDLAGIGKLEFYNPNFDKFPCLKLSYFAAKKGFTMPAVMNAANETAVSAFLNKKIKFTDIAKIVDSVMRAHVVSKTQLPNAFIEADYWARQYSNRLIEKGPNDYNFSNF
jgi:1-deoxy-D-xylulose-5-phosphate reductoisomerase